MLQHSRWSVESHVIWVLWVHGRVLHAQPMTNVIIWHVSARHMIVARWMLRAAARGFIMCREFGYVVHDCMLMVLQQHSLACRCYDVAAATQSQILCRLSCQILCQLSWWASPSVSRWGLRIACPCIACMDLLPSLMLRRWSYRWCDSSWLVCLCVPMLMKIGFSSRGRIWMASRCSLTRWSSVSSWCHVSSWCLLWCDPRVVGSGMLELQRPTADLKKREPAVHPMHVLCVSCTYRGSKRHWQWQLWQSSSYSCIANNSA